MGVSNAHEVGRNKRELRKISREGAGRVFHRCERTHKSIAAGDEIAELAGCKFTATSEISKHPATLCFGICDKARRLFLRVLERGGAGSFGFLALAQDVGVGFLA
jgi:hypothetical protein